MRGRRFCNFRVSDLHVRDTSLFWVPALFSGLQGHFVSEKKSNPIGLLDFWVMWVKKGRAVVFICLH